VEVVVEVRFAEDAGAIGEREGAVVSGRGIGSILTGGLILGTCGMVLGAGGGCAIPAVPPVPPCGGTPYKVRAHAQTIAARSNFILCLLTFAELSLYGI